MTHHLNKPFAVILAGGSGRRMGHVSKPLVQLNKRPMIEYVIDSLQAQSDQILISHNDNDALYAHMGLVMLHDDAQPPQGPLAGILSAMEHINHQVETPHTVWLLSAAADCPFLPNNFGEGLINAVKLSKKPAAFIQHQGQAHFLNALWSVALLPELKRHLNEGNYSVRSFLTRIGAEQVNYARTAGVGEKHQQPFFNINTPEDLALAEALITSNNV